MVKYFLSPVLALVMGFAAQAADATLMILKKDNRTFLSWSTELAPVVRQEVFRSATGSTDDGELIAVLAPDQLTYEDTSADPQLDYWYWVDVVETNNDNHSSNVSDTLSPRSTMAVAASSECYGGAVIRDRTVDCGGATIGLNCPGDGEGQPAVLTLENATVKNVRISASGGADGIHCESGTCRLENVIWEDVCEDAATNNGNTMTIVGGVAYNSNNGYGGKPDKVFQHNSKHSNTIIQGNFTLTGQHGKLYRSCGNCTNNGGPRYLTVISATVDAEIGSIAGVNRNYGDRATIRSLRIRNYRSGDPKVCEEYEGVEKGQGDSHKYGEAWETNACNVSRSNISSF